MGAFYNEYKSKKIFKEFGLPTGEFELAATEDEAVEIASYMGYPVVMKIVSDQIIHKTEAKGIKLGLGTKAAVKSSFRELVNNGKAYDKDAVIEGVLISPMFPAGIECIIGGIQDNQFGPIVMFGLGGVFVEIFKDVKFRMAPVSKHEALKSICSIKGFPMLNGARGRTPVNIDALADVLVKVSLYMADHPEVKEVDLNPVSCYDDKVIILDASIGF